MNRDCNKCIHHISGKCDAWVCDMKTLKDYKNGIIDEFKERLKKKILEEIDDVSESQRNYEVGSEMSITCSHIMGSLRDVHHRIIDEIVEQMKGGAE